MLRNLIIRLHCCFVIGDLRVNLTLSVIDDFRSLDDGISDQSLRGDHDVVLLLLLCDGLLNSDVSGLESVFEFLGEISFGELKSLHPREAFLLEYSIKSRLHISLNSVQ